MPGLVLTPGSSSGSARPGTHLAAFSSVVIEPRYPSLVGLAMHAPGRRGPSTNLQAQPLAPLPRPISSRATRDRRHRAAPCWIGFARAPPDHPRAPPRSAHLDAAGCRPSARDVRLGPRAAPSTSRTFTPAAPGRTPEEPGGPALDHQHRIGDVHLGSSHCSAIAGQHRGRGGIRPGWFRGGDDAPAGDRRRPRPVHLGTDPGDDVGGTARIAGGVSGRRPPQVALSGAAGRSAALEKVPQPTIRKTVAIAAGAANRRPVRARRRNVSTAFMIEILLLPTLANRAANRAGWARCGKCPVPGQTSTAIDGGPLVQPRLGIGVEVGTSQVEVRDPAASIDLPTSSIEWSTARSGPRAGRASSRGRPLAGAAGRPDELLRVGAPAVRRGSRPRRAARRQRSPARAAGRRPTQELRNRGRTGDQSMLTTPEVG